MSSMVPPEEESTPTTPSAMDLDRMALPDLAVHLLDGGASPTETRDVLIARGLEPSQADEMVDKILVDRMRAVVNLGGRRALRVKPPPHPPDSRADAGQADLLIGGAIFFIGALVTLASMGQV